mmetsp:Transcript_14992/g.56478  ORF Transcript_14992/g.56478 Transcript_14992/m.56478 type:complete len:283 (-) Transcript_14992:962-1810(-)
MGGPRGAVPRHARGDGAHRGGGGPLAAPPRRVGGGGPLRRGRGVHPRPLRRRGRGRRLRGCALRVPPQPRRALPDPHPAPPGHGLLEPGVLRPDHQGVRAQGHAGDAPGRHGPGDNGQDGLRRRQRAHCKPPHPRAGAGRRHPRRRRQGGHRCAGGRAAGSAHHRTPPPERADGGGAARPHGGGALAPVRLPPGALAADQPLLPSRATGGARRHARAGGLLGGGRGRRARGRERVGARLGDAPERRRGLGPAWQVERLRADNEQALPHAGRSGRAQGGGRPP